MAAEIDNEDVVEEILTRLEVTDIVHCKNVCKSWRSLISSPRFINRHLNLHRNHHAHTRIALKDQFRFPNLGFCDPSQYNSYQMVGSANGLVCIYAVAYGIFVCNPLTKEMRRLKLGDDVHYEGVCGLGFGYDSSSDDYKVFVTERIGRNQTCVQVLSLKSNIWRHIGVVNYIFDRDMYGTLCNGALHWIVRDKNWNDFIISFDLTDEEFKEIPRPDDAIWLSSWSFRLGIINEHLCLFRSRFSFTIWMMKKDNVKESWELLQGDHLMKHGTLHLLKTTHNPYRTFPELWLSDVTERIDRCYPCVMNLMFVPSLVSPYPNGRSQKASIKKRIVRYGGCRLQVIKRGV